MSIITLDEAKTVLRIDFTDEDIFVQTLIDAATDHLTMATGVVFDNTVPLAKTVCLMLIAEWYSNREIARQLDAGPGSVLNTLMTQLAISHVATIQVPKGLTAIAETGNIFVRWLVNIESNLDGYNLYRDGTKINTELIRERKHWMEWPLAWGDWPYPRWVSQRHDQPGVMAYHDGAIQSGANYSYQVTAVDTLGNESAKSSAVQVTSL